MNNYIEKNQTNSTKIKIAVIITRCSEYIKILILYMHVLKTTRN